jgi:hypothetical protein
MKTKIQLHLLLMVLMGLLPFNQLFAVESIQSQPTKIEKRTAEILSIERINIRGNIRRITEDTVYIGNFAPQGRQLKDYQKYVRGNTLAMPIKRVKKIRLNKSGTRRGRLFRPILFLGSIGLIILLLNMGNTDDRGDSPSSFYLAIILLVFSLLIGLGIGLMNNLFDELDPEVKKIKIDGEISKEKIKEIRAFVKAQKKAKKRKKNRENINNFLNLKK